MYFKNLFNMRLCCVTPKGISFAVRSCLFNEQVQGCRLLRANPLRQFSKQSADRLSFPPNTNFGAGAIEIGRRLPVYPFFSSQKYRLSNNFAQGFFKFPCGARFYSQSEGTSRKEFLKQRNTSVAFYVGAIIVLMIGGSYAAVPLYQVFCQATGLGGEVKRGHDIDKVEDMKRVDHRILTINFNADTHASMRWNFRPQQSEVKVAPGETALAFYSAMNPTDKPIVGISTYNVVPFSAGQYFNKIQCFCFEEQRLNPHEQVDMPVFFYIDPEFADDPLMEKVDTITLSYTFFEAKEGFVMPENPYRK